MKIYAVTLNTRAPDLNDPAESPETEDMRGNMICLTRHQTPMMTDSFDQANEWRDELLAIYPKETYIIMEADTGDKMEVMPRVLDEGVDDDLPF